jgi:hypothetical protein
MNSACLRKRARNDSVRSLGTTKVLARTMGPVSSLNWANIGVCGSRLRNLAIFGYFLSLSICRYRLSHGTAGGHRRTGSGNAHDARYLWNEGI